MKKNVFGCLLVLMLVFGFIGCGGDDSGTTTYTVTFESNGGSNVASIGGITSGATITLPPAPTKKDNAFSGWFIDNNDFTKSFTALTSVIDNITVYAKWIYNPYFGSWAGLAGDGKPMTLTFAELTFEINGTGWKQKGTYTFTENSCEITVTHLDTGNGVWLSEPNLSFGFDTFPKSFQFTKTGNTIEANGSVLTKQP